MKTGRELAQQQFNEIVNLQPTRVKLGHGSFITMDFGKDIPEEIKTRQGIEVVYFGEWHLWIYMCAWRLDKNGEPLVGSNDLRAKIEEYLIEMQSRKISKVNVLSDEFDLQISFEDHVDLHLFSSKNQEGIQWLFYTPNGKVFNAGPGMNWSYEDA